MTKGAWIYGCFIIALCFSFCSIAAAATVTQNINYQGVLTDAAGNPLSGTYSMTFRLYNVTSGGTALSTSINASVVCMNGTFTTPVAFDSGFFDGRALWVSVAVGVDSEMTPRQEIRPEPYALSLRPGALIKGLTASSTGLRVLTDASSSTSIYAETNGTNSPAVRAHTYSDTSNAVWGSTSGNGPAALVGITSGDGSPGVYAVTSGEGCIGVYGNATGPGSDGVSGESAQSTGVHGRGVTGGFFETNQAGYNHGVSVDTDYDNNIGTYVVTHGQHSHGIKAETFGNTSFGLVATTAGKDSPAVFGWTMGEDSEGVFAYAGAPKSRAIYAYSQNDAGIFSSGVWGGIFETNQEGSPGFTPNGIWVNASYNNNRGIIVTTSGQNSPGITSQTTNSASNGVHSTTSGTTSHALYGDATGPSSNGVVAFSTCWTAIYADTLRADQLYGIYTPDYLYAKGTQVPSTDVAEYMPVAENVTPGTVLVIGSDGILQESTVSYDPKVAGIVSTQPGVTLGTKDGGNPGEAQVAVSGRVPCKVDSTKAPIHPGDLLTTSDTPGCAMKAEPTMINGRGFYPDGTILGKAMGTLESGTGTIEVLVTLQ